VERPEVPEAVVPLVVWRKGFQVFHSAVSAAEARALSGVLSGHDMPSVCEAFVDGPEPVAAAFQAIGSWIAEGMMSELHVEE
jgi:NAD(P)H-dependent flavin oxidoreductase YrpB (nitropropane dioxygenase family)